MEGEDVDGPPSLVPEVDGQNMPPPHQQYHQHRDSLSAAAVAYTEVSASFLNIFHFTYMAQLERHLDSAFGDDGSIPVDFFLFFIHS